MIEGLIARRTFTDAESRRLGLVKHRARARLIGGEHDGVLSIDDYKRLNFLRWQMEHGHVSDWGVLSDERARELCAAIMERIKTDA